MTCNLPTNSGGSSNKIKVICRVRPGRSTAAGEGKDLLQKRQEKGESVIVEVKEVGKELLVVNKRNPAERLKYNFDNCYGPDTSQDIIFKENVEPLLTEVYRGLDATIFCYGMTGAGKTYTIQGPVENPGLIPRCMQAIFKYRDNYLTQATDNSSDTCRFEVRVSYMEIYLETVFDLFQPRDLKTRSGLTIREDAKRNVFVSGLERKVISCFTDFETEYNKGCKNRSTAATLLNQESSRSHAILGIEITIHSETGKTFKSKLNLIDLAGSEDNRRTNNNSIRLCESSSINQSLHALGKVVDAINRRASQIPYRDSKMTRILQSKPTLGGKALGMLIVNIAPEEKFFFETYRALNFATKSKEIINNPVFNEIEEIRNVRDLDSVLPQKSPRFSSTPRDSTLRSLMPRTSMPYNSMPRSSTPRMSLLVNPSRRALPRVSSLILPLRKAPALPLARQSSVPSQFLISDSNVQSLNSSFLKNSKTGNIEALIFKSKEFDSHCQLADTIHCYEQESVPVQTSPVAKQDSDSLHSSKCSLSPIPASKKPGLSNSVPTKEHSTGCITTETEKIELPSRLHSLSPELESKDKNSISSHNLSQDSIPKHLESNLSDCSIKVHNDSSSKILVLSDSSLVKEIDSRSNVVTLLNSSILEPFCSPSKIIVLPDASIVNELELKPQQIMTSPTSTKMRVVNPPPSVHQVINSLDSSPAKQFSHPPPEVILLDSSLVQDCHSCSDLIFLPNPISVEEAVMSHSNVPILPLTNMSNSRSEAIAPIEPLSEKILRTPSPKATDSSDSTRSKKIKPVSKKRSFSESANEPNSKRPKYNLRGREHRQGATYNDELLSISDEAASALTNPRHFLVPLINMGKSDLLRALWPIGKKARDGITNYIRTRGPITILKDLITSDTISETHLLQILGNIYD